MAGIAARHNYAALPLKNSEPHHGGDHQGRSRRAFDVYKAAIPKEWNDQSGHARGQHEVPK